jgi:hypothetical protein
MPARPQVIGSIFHATGCRLPPGVDTEVTDGSLLTYLGMIEQRANEIIQAQAQVKPTTPSASTLTRDGTTLGGGIFARGL